MCYIALPQDRAQEILNHDLPDDDPDDEDRTDFEDLAAEVKFGAFELPWLWLLDGETLRAEIRDGQLRWAPNGSAFVAEPEFPAWREGKGALCWFVQVQGAFLELAPPSIEALPGGNGGTTKIRSRFRRNMKRYHEMLEL